MANPNPDTSGLKPAWAPGVSPNPGGKTSEQKRREMRNAEMATRLRERMLEAELRKIEASADAVPELTSEMLKLLKDSEDRGLGAPTNKTAFTDPDGNGVGGRFTVEFIGPSGSGEGPADL